MNETIQQNIHTLEGSSTHKNHQISPNNTSKKKLNNQTLPKKDM
jgi:hypothetical protein